MVFCVPWVILRLSIFPEICLYIDLFVCGILRIVHLFRLYLDRLYGLNVCTVLLLLLLRLLCPISFVADWDEWMQCSSVPLFNFNFFCSVRISFGHLFLARVRVCVWCAHYYHMTACFVLAIFSLVLFFVLTSCWRKMENVRMFSREHWACIVCVYNTMCALLDSSYLLCLSQDK